MNCSTGCPTPGAHSSYGECLREKGVRKVYADSANGNDYSREKAFRKTNEAYRNAVAAGRQPAGVDMKSIRAVTEN